MFHHACNHTKDVLSRAALIAAALGLSPHHVLLMQIGAAFHDVVQEWDPVEKGSGVIVRRRRTVLNEEKSVAEARSFMKTLPMNFHEWERKEVDASILATVAEWNEAHQTVVQPNLTVKSHRLVLAVALADLGAAGMDPVSFIRDGWTLFAEDQIDIAMTLSAARRSEDIDEVVQEKYRERFLAWLSTQAAFARGRKELFFHEVQGLDVAATQRMRMLFSHFDESIAAADEECDRFETMDFVSLARHLVPDAFPDEG